MGTHVWHLLTQHVICWQIPCDSLLWIPASMASSKPKKIGTLFSGLAVSICFDDVFRFCIISRFLFGIFFLEVSKNRGHPQIIYFKRILPYKPSILGYSPSSRSLHFPIIFHWSMINPSYSPLFTFETNQLLGFYHWSIGVQYTQIILMAIFHLKPSILGTPQPL